MGQLDQSAPLADDAPLQSAAAVLLVRPARFGFNAQTAGTNLFQSPPHGDAAAPADAAEPIAAGARTEFDGLVVQLRAAGVRTCTVEDTAWPEKPDAVFPNNWVSFHRDGTVVLYPMQAPNRRLERRAEVIEAVCGQLDFRRRRLLDLTDHENRGRFLEGTGSLVLDHRRRVAYACRSARTDETLVRLWARALDYEPIVFDAVDATGAPIYHTNVMLAIGTHWAVICAEAIAPPMRARVLQRLAADRLRVIEISHAAVTQFAANVLELRGGPAAGRRLLAVSCRARSALQAAGQWPALAACVDGHVSVDLAQIERHGGGGIRCMLAEVPVPAGSPA